MIRDRMENWRYSMKKYNIFIWNIKCSAGTGYGNTSLMEHILKGFESYIKKCFEKEKKSPDIIILNEFYKLKDYHFFAKKMDDMGYNIFVDENPTKKYYNQVLIATSKKGIEFISKPICKFPEQSKTSNLPNYLSVLLESSNSKMAIIGTRIRWHGIWNNKEKKYKVNKESFEQRKKEFNELINLIKEIKSQDIKKIIIGGDFNNGKIRGNRDDFYVPDGIDYPYKGFDHENYNYHIIKNELRKIGFQVLTPEGYSIDNFALDHLIVPEYCNVEIGSLKYVEMEGSDHKALVAEIEL